MQIGYFFLSIGGTTANEFKTWVKIKMDIVIKNKNKKTLLHIFVLKIFLF